MPALCLGGDGDGRKQDDGLLVDEAQESGGNNFNCRRIARGSRLPFDSRNMAEQGVVVANRARYGRCAILADICMDRN